MNKNTLIWKVWILITAVLFMLTIKVYSQEVGAAFLKIGVGARPAALGGSFVALADDINSIYWNPAGLGQLKKAELSAMYASWLEDINYEFVSFATPLKDKQVFGVSVAMLQISDMEKRGDNRENLGSFKATDSCAIISFSKLVNHSISMGINLKVISQKIDDESAAGFALDMGSLWGTGIQNLTVGLSVRNLGTKMSFIEQSYDLPLTLAGGVAYRIPAQNLTLASDFNYYAYRQKASLSIGAEYELAKIIALDLGYKLEKDNKLAGLVGLSAGVGFKLDKFTLNYAWVPYGELGDTHRVSVGMKF